MAVTTGEAAPMSALESAFLWMETDREPLHVGCLLLFDGIAPSPAELSARMADRLTDVPALRASVSFPSRRRPAWQVHPRVDFAHHVQATELTPRGDRDALRALVSTLMTQRLEPSRPLWRLWVVEGCPDGQWGLVVKAHHSLVDGQSGSDLLGCLLDRVDGAQISTPAERSRPRSGAWNPIAAARRLRRGLVTLARPDLPPSVLNGPLGIARGWDWAAFDRASLEDAARRRGCTVNDLFLAALAGAARSVLLSQPEPIEEVVVRTIVPVSQRDPSHVVQRGTIASAMFVELPVQLPTVSERLDAVMRRSGAQKEGQIATGTQAVLSAAEHVPAAILARAASAYTRHGQHRVNAAASNVRGASGSFELLGRPLRQAVPWIPLALEVRLTTAMLSFGSTTCVSVSVDGDAIPDVGAVMRALANDLTELLAV